jgi:AsmA protein
MTGKAEKRRPLAVAIASLGLIGAALVGPVLIGSRGTAPMPGSTVHADSRETIAIAAPLEISTAPRVIIESGNVALVGENAGGSAVGKVFRALVLGGGSDLVLDNARIVVDGSASPLSQPATDAADLLGPLVSALKNFKFRSLVFLNTTVAVTSPAGAVETIEDVNAEVVTDRNGLVKAKGRMEVRGEPMDFDVSFVSMPSDGKDAKDAIVRVHAEINGKLLKTAFDGRLTFGESAKITAERAELSLPNARKTADWLGISWPDGRGLGTFTAKGALTLRPNAVSFEHAEFTLDGNAATGALSLKSGAERPIIEGTLAFPNFDIAPYLAPASTSPLVRASQWASGLRMPGFAEASFIRATDADVRISTGNVMNGSTRLGRFAASVSVQNGKLYGELAEIEFEQGGKGEGQLAIDMTGSEPHYTLRTELEDIDLPMVAAGRIVPPIVEGAGDITVHLTARGTTEAEVLDTISGTMSLEIQEGARLGIDIDALSEASKATPPLGWGPATARTTALNSLVARFKASHGVLTTDAVEATTDDRVLSLAGSVDIDKGAVDLVLSIGQLEINADTKAAKAAGAYRIRGPWSAPAISPAERSKDARSMSSGPNPG